MLTRMMAFGFQYGLFTLEWGGLEHHPDRDRYRPLGDRPRQPDTPS